MRIKSLELENFLSFKKSGLNFIENNDELPTIFVVNGINYDNDDDDASNGSGKSAFIGESVFYNIFGRGLRGTNKKLKLNDMIKYGANKMFNNVTYYIKNDGIEQEMTIERVKSIKGASTMDIMIDGEEKTKRLKSLSENEIRAYIDFSPEVFSQVIVYYKDNLNLLSMNFAQRLDLFKNIVDISILDTYYEKFKDFKNLNNKFLDALDIKLKGTKDILNIIDNNKDEYISYLYKNKEEIEKNIAESELIAIADTTEFQRQQKIVKEKINNYKEELTTISNNLFKNRSDKDKIEKEIKKFNSLSGGDCPTCKQPISNDYSDILIKEYQKNIEEINKNNIEFIEQEKEIQKNIKSLNSKAESIEEEINKIKMETMSREQKIRNYKSELVKINNEIKNNQTNPSENINKTKYENVLHCLETAIANRERWKLLNEYWFNMFAPKSLLRSSIIRKYIVILSDIFEYYVSKLYNNEITGSLEIDDDGNIDILLFKDNFESNYWQLSSGERKRIDLAMMFSLYEFTSNLNSNIPKFMILDEIYDSLDYPGRLAVTTTLVELQQRHNIDLYIISHIPLPMENIPENVVVKNILVSKKDKCSEVKFLEAC